MPKRSLHWKRLHKIKVHHNRWLVWTIAIAVLVCSAVLAQIQISNIHFETQMGWGVDSASNWVTFKHKSDGYSIKYPRTWAVEMDTPLGVSFVNLENYNEFVSVAAYPVSEEPVIRRELTIARQVEVKVAGHNAVMVVQRRDPSEAAVLVKDGDKLFVIRGRSDKFERIVGNIKFTEKLERI
jgi:hypothetical protein